MQRGDQPFPFPGINVALLADVRDRGNELLRGIIAQHAGHGRAGVQVPAFRSCLEYPLQGVFKNGAVLFLGQPEAGLGLPAAANVVQEQEHQHGQPPDHGDGRGHETLLQGGQGVWSHTLGLQGDDAPAGHGQGLAQHSVFPAVQGHAVALQVELQGHQYHVAELPGLLEALQGLPGKGMNGVKEPLLAVAGENHPVGRNQDRQRLMRGHGRIDFPDGYLERHDAQDVLAPFLAHRNAQIKAPGLGHRAQGGKNHLLALQGSLEIGPERIVNARERATLVIGAGLNHSPAVHDPNEFAVRQVIGRVQHQPHLGVVPRGPSQEQLAHVFVPGQCLDNGKTGGDDGGDALRELRQPDPIGLAPVFPHELHDPKKTEKDQHQDQTNQIQQCRSDGAPCPYGIQCATFPKKKSPHTPPLT